MTRRRKGERGRNGAGDRPAVPAPPVTAPQQDVAAPPTPIAPPPVTEQPPSCETGPVVAEKGGPPPLFRLTVATADGVSPNMPVRWCLSRDALTQLRDKQARDPHLLVILARENEGAELGHRLEETKRMLIPLDRGMERIVFPNAGKHRVFAAVVWSMKEVGVERWHDLYSLFLGKGMVGYVHEVVNGESCCLARWYDQGAFNVFRLNHIAELRVRVDERFFAKEPPAWLSWYVNLWCEGKPCDECDFRNRALWAFGIKWLPMLFWCLFAGVVRTVWAALLLLMGRRGVDPRPIWHPFAWSIADVHEGVEKERKLRDPAHYWTLTKGDGKRRGALFFAATTPLLWCVYAGMAWWMWRRYGDLFMWDAWAVQYVAYMAIAAFGWVAVVVTLDAVFRYFNGVIEEMAVRNIASASKERLTSEVVEKMRQRAKLERFYAQRLEPLACPDGVVLPGARSKVTVDALPPSHQTLHLRFEDLKARVCKPFAQ